ncbi:hypothetical protein BJ138DRAFT_132744, partial [Hygrophoropsis aurantiaca]
GVDSLNFADEELPPSYSFSPNFLSGETTLAIGPAETRLDPYSPSHTGWSTPRSIPVTALELPELPEYPASSVPPWETNVRPAERTGIIGSLVAAVRSYTNATETSASPRPRAGSMVTSHLPQSSVDVPDDGSPTIMPVPGHPLLKNGMLLVYPGQFFCMKCRNTGYKNYQPSNPCRKCWTNFSKPYNGRLFANLSSTSKQRALPVITPLRVSS